MCRNIRTLHNFEPPATDAEIRAAALQFVRKVAGASRPSRANAQAYETAVARIAENVRTLLGTLTTKAPPKNRDVEAARARARFAGRGHNDRDAATD